MVEKQRNVKALSFLESALAVEGLHSLKNFRKWYQDKLRSYVYKVEQKPLEKLNKWNIDKATGNISHESGKFFQVIGIDVETNFGGKSNWQQPIINQPEIGILGFVAKNIEGVLHFLVQAKMEPGNVNLLQISPTVQATRSNYTAVHEGKKPLYLEYFLDPTKASILIDQLQSEQGARYLAKRNRNIIVEVEEDELNEPHPDFYWLSLGQISCLLQENNLINMDARTVLSSVPFDNDFIEADKYCKEQKIKGFYADIFHSYFAQHKEEVNSFDKLLSWFTHLKIHNELRTKIIALNSVKDWQHKDGVIKHAQDKFFKILGVAVKADREVASWDQPLIESAKGGVICFICQKKRNVLHFLVQARVEPGNFDILEMAPTVQFTHSNYQDSTMTLPKFADLVINAKPNQVKFDTLQSEEGGRFYHDQNRYMVIEIDEGKHLDLPDNFIWMSLRQMKEFIRFNNYLNIEARGLLACLGLRGA